MTEYATGGSVPQWDLGDRMRKALKHAGISVEEIADYLGVTRGTVSTWVNGRIVPSVQTLRLWAMQTGVDYEWLAGSSPPHRRRGAADTGVTVRKRGRRSPLRRLAGAAA